ncbi:hypothetical protein KUTeg_002623 [Tegillarca granosa]|uniref:Obscurin n=1 Tax=Tegillarca granosa TaxID=220873 RepID=A0ABQ9FUX1_TEGGR|nr:hypothetical protein KUTeg_002623 [Tegillarca granosa]
MSQSVEQSESIVNFEPKTRNIGDIGLGVHISEEGNFTCDQPYMQQYEDNTQSPCFTKEVATADDELQYVTKSMEDPEKLKLKFQVQDENNEMTDKTKEKPALFRTNELPVEAGDDKSTWNSNINGSLVEAMANPTAISVETISKTNVKPSQRVVELLDGKEEIFYHTTETCKNKNGDFSLTTETQTNTSKEIRPPRILNITSDVTVEEGDTLVVQWDVTGFPEPRVDIFKDDENVQDFEWIQLYKDENKYTMRIDNSQKEDTGYYIIHVSNEEGRETFEACVVVKDKVPDVQLNEREAIIERPPEFIVAPSQCTFKQGEPAVIKTKVTGSPQPVVEWLKDGQPLETNNDISIYVDEEYQYLNVNSVGLSDGGQYTCRAKNELGVNQINFTVDVEERKADGSNQTPSCPFVQLEVSESYEFMPKKFLLAADYEDTNNDVSLQQGEIIELLDKSLQSHWLVRDLKKRQRICYVPSALLHPIQEGDEFDYIGINGQQSVNMSEEQKLRAEERKRNSIANLVESETDYICDMKDLMENYYDALEEKFPDMMMDENKDIYKNLTDLYIFHKKELLPELIASTENPAKVANLFLEKKDKFEKYIPLCAGKDKVDNILGCEEVRQFIQAFSQALGDPDTAFTDLLNRPVDRIHEYIELLKSLIKYTALAGGDCTQLISAVQMLTDLCREVENLMFLDKVQGYDGNVKDLGPVIRHDKVTLWKEDEVTVPEGERHIFLFPDKIMVTKIVKPAKSPADFPELKFENVIDLKDVEINEDVQEDTKRVELWDRYIKESDLLNELTSPSITLQASNIYDKQAWVRDIKEAQQKLGVESTLKDKMPERRKIKTKTPKMVTSTPKKKEKHGSHMDNESDRSSDDFKIIDTSRDVNVSYTTPEFEDGTTRPMFKKKLQKTYVENSTARLECVVAGIPLPKVLWLKNNRPLKDSDKCNVIVDGDTNILEFPKADRDDTGLYTARAMNANGSTISTAELYVGDVQPSALTKYKEGLIESEFKTPAYFFQMNSCQVEEGRLARFDCRVVAYPRPDIVWMKDGKIVEPGDRHKLLNFNNEIYSLLIQNVELIDKGRYTCWAHNKYGEAMTEAYLNVIALEDRVEDEDIAPKFLTKFYDQTITDGLPAEFQCMIDGRPQPVVRWLLNDIEIHPSPDIMVYSENNLCALRIKEVKQKDGGKYKCHISNNLGEASCVANLSVVDKKIKGVPVLPKFLKKIGDTDLKTGEDHTFEVVVVGEPAPKVTWLYNHKPISPTHRRFITSQEGDIYRLTINDVQFEDDGKFTCKAVNSEGEVYCSGNVKVTKARKVPDEPEQLKFKQTDFDAKYGCAPTFMKKLEDISAPEGNDAKFECRVMGIPEPEVIWTKDGKAIKSDGHYLVTQDGSGHCILHIKNVQPRDKGVYTCTVSNPAGQTACTGQLRIGTPKESLDRESALQPTRRLSRESISKLQALPTMPHEKPTILDVRPDSARLSWIPVSTLQLPPEAKNITYVIEAKELPHGYDWKKMASGIHGHTHLVKNLRPDIEYAFRVRAENQFGISDASPQVIMERHKPEIAEEEKVPKFRIKLPESKKPPKLPTTRPVITEMGQESVRLAWKPAVPLPTAKKTLPVSYRLEAQELPGTDWLPFASRISDISHYLPELSQDRDYNIRVRAENKYGLSEPTEPLWIPRATAFPGVPISRPEIVEIEPEAVRLNWQRVEIPAHALDESPLMYMIEMQKPPSQTWKEIARDIPGTTYLVRDLHPGQDYRFRVRARTPVGKMLEPSPAISLYRTLASARVPIDKFELDEYEPDYEGIRLKWAQVKVPPYHLDEEPLLYMIEGQEQPLDEWRPLVSGIPTTHYRITDLVPDRDYKFRVRALSQHGLSPPTHVLPVSYRRQLPAPSRPLTVDHPRLMYDETEALQLAWKPPAVETKRPIKYRVELQAPPSLEWRPLASGIPDTKYRIQGLGPSRDYMFRVIPETTLGPLEALPPVSLTTLAAPRTTLPSRPKILDLQPESLNLSWQRPMLDIHKPLKYRIDVQEAPRLDWQPIAFDVPDTSYRVTGLKPQRDYMFRVVPMTTAGTMEPLPPVSVTSMPVRPRLSQREPRITELSKDSVKLTWQPADIPMYLRHETPVHYIVDMRTLPGQDWKPVTRHVKDTSYVVKNLRPDKEYQFRIKAETDAGVSEPTHPVTIYRKPVPIFPRREPVVTGVSQDSVALSWLPADIATGSARVPVIQYRIEAQYPPGIGPWEPIVSNIQRTSYHVTGLHPDGDYMFRVRAVADGIVSEPTQPVYLTRRAAPPRMPQEQPYIFDMHPDNLKLQWRAVELPSRITDYSPITYRVEFQEGPRSDWMTLARGIPHTDFNVMSLDPEKEYKFRVRAENSFGIGDPTPVVSVPRRAVAPTMPQEEPLMYDLGPHSVNLRWRPAEIPSYLSDGSPITYTIYALEPPGTSWQPIVRRIPHNFYHLANIRPEQEYHFRIQAENRYGVSRPTLPVKLPKMADLRTPVEITDISDIDDKSASLSLHWQPRHLPQFDKVPVKYQVEAWEPRRHTWKRIASNVPDTSFRVSGLAPEDDYMFRVRAEAASLLSEPTYPISLSRFRLPSGLPPLRPQLHDLQPESVRLSWHPLHVPSYQGTRNLFPRYIVEMKEMLGKQWKPLGGNVLETTYRVNGLDADRDYEFRVRGVGDRGLSEPSIPVMLHRRTVLPRIPLSRPEIVRVEDDAINLRWNLVDIPAMRHSDTPLSFMIEQQNLPNYDWSPIARGVSDTSFRITGLRQNQDYAFRIRGELPSGLSEPSPYVPVYRRPRIMSDLVITSDVKPGVPIARPEIWEDEPYKARLRWQKVYIPPFDQFDDLTYRIEIQHPPNRDWRPLVSGIKMTEHEVTDLSPKKDYLFRIRAESPNGDISDPTPPIAYYRSQLPMARESFKIPEYKHIEVDFTGPNRSYIDHLTTYIPPRLPVEKPELFQLSPEKVTLSWKPARVSDRIKGTSKVTYSVEVRTPPSFEWRELASDLTSCVTDLNSLHPELDYIFRVRAYNEYGASEPTLPVSLYRPIELEDDNEFFSDEDLEPIMIGLGEYETTIDEAPPKLPMDTPKIIDQGETAYLSWLAARIPVYAKKTPITYSVEIKEPNVPGWSHFASGITATEFFIEGLKSNADYQFRVKAETQFGCSEPTLPVSLNRSTKKESKRPSMEMKNEDFQVPLSTLSNTIPTGAPPRIPSSRPLITNNFGTSLNLSWMPGRVPTYVKDFKMKYVLEVREPPSEKWRIMADNLMDNTYDVKNLLPDQDYMFRVRVKNEYGSSEPTLPVAVIRQRDDYVPPVLSRQNSRDSGSPWVRSRASSIESLPKQKNYDFLDDTDDDIYPKKASAPEFKSPEDADIQYGVVGKSAKLCLKIRGSPLPNITWQFNGQPLDLGDKIRGFISPNGTVTLEFKKMKTQDAGEYKCVAENEHGIAVRIVQLEEADPPMFLDPLKDLVIDSRGRGRLECRIDGIPYPTVKWMKDSVTLGESTRLKFHHEDPDYWSLTIDSAIMMDSGHYTCVAENNAGQAVSSCRISIAGKDSDEIKLLDFGLSRILYKDFDVKLNFGTPGFTSPEQINNDPLTSAADMWNVGAVTYFFERISVEECLQHPWIKSFTSRGQGVKINLNKMKTFHTEDKKKRRANAVVTNARVISLSSILKPDNPVLGLEPQKNDSGEIVFPDSSSYGEYLDEESWYDWQNRYHQGPETRLDPLVESELSVPMRSYLHGDEGEDLMDDLLSDPDAEVETVSKVHPQVQKECEWRELDADMKYKLPPSDYLDKLTGDSEKKVENPVFLVKLVDVAYNSGENVTLSCQVLSDTTPIVTWFRNEELITDGNRIKTAYTEDNVATLTLVSAKPYDAGVYKCIARNKSGRAFTAARVLHGDVPGQSSRPAVTAVSSSEALLVWEPPATDGNSPVTGEDRWNIYGTVIDECTVVSSLEPNTSYRFRVTCVNNIGLGSYSVASTEIKTKPQEEMVTIVIRQILGALQYLQYEGIVHLNLQPSSVIMVNRNSLQLKITNFELAQKLEGYGRVMPRAGYPDFIAPEVVAREKTSYPADVWTVGTLAFLLNRLTPDDCLDDKWLQLSEIKVKSQREAIFTTPKLRVYADIYQERCMTGVYTITPTETKPATILEDKPATQDLIKPKAESEKDKEIKAPSVGKLSVKPPEAKTPDVAPKTSEPKVKTEEVQKKKTVVPDSLKSSNEKMKDDDIKGNVKIQNVVAPKSDKTQQESKPAKQESPMPPVTEQKKEKPLPATEPEKLKKDKPLPATEPLEPKKDKPLPATEPEKLKKDKPLPATEPLEPKKDKPLPATESEEPKKDKPLPVTEPVKPKKDMSLPAIESVEPKKDKSLPDTESEMKSKKEPVVAEKPKTKDLKEETKETSIEKQTNVEQQDAVVPKSTETTEKKPEVPKEESVAKEVDDVENMEDDLEFEDAIQETKEEMDDVDNIEDEQFDDAVQDIEEKDSNKEKEPEENKGDKIDKIATDLVSKAMDEALNLNSC